MHTIEATDLVAAARAGRETVAAVLSGFTVDELNAEISAFEAARERAERHGLRAPMIEARTCRAALETERDRRTVLANTPEYLR